MILPLINAAAPLEQPAAIRPVLEGTAVPAGAAPGAVAGPTPAAAHRATVARKLAAMIAAGNRIAHRPYVYGGGHGSFQSTGYDCSGSVSYVLHAAHLIGAPADSTQLQSYGLPGPGKHVTIYANAGHALMTVRGRRFDTIAYQETGTRWSSTVGDVGGYVVRHPRGM